jgi:hypothetical protein
VMFWDRSFNVLTLTGMALAMAPNRLVDGQPRADRARSVSEASSSLTLQARMKMANYFFSYNAEPLSLPSVRR